ncbi:PREDICTED: uncharacterized protein LOC108750414 [Trachymyrmex septentrionalis]|uniref:uncharacterized protein LOC108750414 n=1 Tax=Trachymyrmex septentrionalis TaxID=34720 RepID=UPI00084EDBD5|nr:PREDICTED: uncharacterized protein LOC108750414 [Trachymyrmex septentrionalis]
MVGFLEKLLTFDITKSRWRRIPFDVTEENPAGYTGKCERRKMKSVSKSTRLPDDKRGFSRSRTQSLHILPPANKDILANDEDVYKRIVIITSTFVCLYQIFAFMCNTNTNDIRSTQQIAEARSKL